MSGDITFYSAWYCPFAQRAWIALEHLGLPYTYVETDPYHKSSHWMLVSRDTGQVPVLQVDIPFQSPSQIPGSLRILEYLDDARGGLFPESALDRVEARFWLGHQGANIVPQFYRFLKAQTASDAEKAKADMLAGLATFTGAMSETGPFFFGPAPGVVDFALAPFAYRIETLLPHYKDFQLPRRGAGWPRYWKWSQAVQGLASFHATMPRRDSYDARLLAFYRPYSLGGGQKDVTEAA